MRLNMGTIQIWPFQILLMGRSMVMMINHGRCFNDLMVFPRFFDKSISFLGAVVLHMVNFLLQAMTMSDVRPRLTHCFFHFLSIHVDKLRIVCTNTAPYIIIHTVIIYYI